MAPHANETPVSICMSRMYTSQLAVQLQLIWVLVPDACIL